jgi:hypothetical protein
MLVSTRCEEVRISTATAECDCGECVADNVLTATAGLRAARWREKRWVPGWRQRGFAGAFVFIPPKRH